MLYDKDMIMELVEEMSRTRLTTWSERFQWLENKLEESESECDASELDIY